MEALSRSLDDRAGRDGARVALGRLAREASIAGTLPFSPELDTPLVVSGIDGDGQLDLARMLGAQGRSARCRLTL